MYFDMLYFFFSSRRRHTRLVSDWSSDVCSSEVETTVDFCPRNPIISWMVGGLNYQIEHHLFPRVPHTHYAQIAKIVQRNAELHGVRYVAQRSLWGALRSHFRHLRTMGRLGVP